MILKRSWTQNPFLTVAGFTAGVILMLELPASVYAQAGYVHRGTPARQGRAWVEHAVCGAPVREGGRLILRADFGSVTAQPGASGQMTCKVRLQAYKSSQEEARRIIQSYELSIRLLEDGEVLLTGRTQRFDARQDRLAVDYEITVPLKFNLDLQTQGGELAVGNLDGELRAVTAGGDIRSGDVAGPVHAETAGGDINLGNLGQRVEARTAGGSIHVSDVKGDAFLETSGGEIRAGRIEGSARLRTAGGDILLRGAVGPVHAETAGGQIQIGPCDASIRAETAGGSIRVQGAQGRVEVETAGGSIDLFRLQNAVRAETAAGRILVEINANRDSFGPSRLDTSVGDIEVFLPPDLPLNIDAAIEQAFGHRIISDFPLHIQGEEESFRQRSQRGEAALNGGGKPLRIRTIIGNIEIRKLDPRTIEELKVREEMFRKLWQERQQPQPKDPDGTD